MVNPPLHSTGDASRLNCVARRSHIGNMLPPRALYWPDAGFHDGLLADESDVPAGTSAGAVSGSKRVGDCPRVPAGTYRREAGDQVQATALPGACTEGPAGTVRRGDDARPARRTSAPCPGSPPPARAWRGVPLGPVMGRLTQEDIAIGPHTATPAWRGERLDVGWAVGVLWRPRPATVSVCSSE